MNSAVLATTKKPEAKPQSFKGKKLKVTGPDGRAYRFVWSHDRAPSQKDMDWAVGEAKRMSEESPVNPMAGGLKVEAPKQEYQDRPASKGPIPMGTLAGASPRNQGPEGFFERLRSAVATVGGPIGMVAGSGLAKAVTQNAPAGVEKSVGESSRLIKKVHETVEPTLAGARKFAGQVGTALASPGVRPPKEGYSAARSVGKAVEALDPTQLLAVGGVLSEIDKPGKAAPKGTGSHAINGVMKFLARPAAPALMFALGIDEELATKAAGGDVGAMEDLVGRMFAGVAGTVPVAKIAGAFRAKNPGVMIESLVKQSAMRAAEAKSLGLISGTLENPKLQAFADSVGVKAEPVDAFLGPPKAEPPVPVAQTAPGAKVEAGATPKTATGRVMYREANPREFLSNDYANPGAWWADNPDLAIGQGANKGMVFEMEFPEGAKLVKGSKQLPEGAGAEWQIGAGNQQGSASGRAAGVLKSVTVKQGAKLPKDVSLNLQRFSDPNNPNSTWTREVLPNGDTKYTPIEKAPKTADVPVTESVATTEGRTTAHADVDAVRATVGWDPRQTTKETIALWVGDAKKLAGRESAIADDVLEKTRQATKAEEAALGIRLNQLLDERDAAKGAGDLDAYDIADREANKIADALDTSGSEWGRQGVARQIVLKADYSDFGLKRRVLKAKGVDELGKADLYKITVLSNQVQDLESRLQAALARKGAGSSLRPGRGTVADIRARRADALSRLKVSGGKAAAEVLTAPVNVITGVGGGGVSGRYTAEAFTAMRDLAGTYIDEGIVAIEELVSKLKEHKVPEFEDRDLATAAKEALGVHARNINRGRVAFGEDMIAAGQWAIKDKEIAKLRAELDIARAEADAHVKSLEPKHWTVKVLNETAGGIRALRLAYDLGALLRQGFMGISKPGKYGKAVLAGIRGMHSDTMAVTMNHALKERIIGERYMAPVRKKAGLQLTDTLTMQEEAFMSNFMRMIPVVKSIYGGTERFQVSFMNSLRADFFDSFATKFTDATDDELKQYAQFVNNAFGRSNFKEVSDYANIAFTSPRWTTSRFGLLENSVRAGLTLNSKASKAIVEDVAKVVGVWYGAYKMLEASGGEVEWDPESNDFLKVRYGDTTYDFTGGLSRPTRAVLRASIGMVGHWFGKQGKQGQDPQSEIGKYLANSLSPAARGLYEWTSGETIGGYEIDEEEKGMKKFIPLIAAQAWTHIEQDGLGPGTVKILPEFVGVSSQKIPKRTKPLQIRKTQK